MIPGGRRAAVLDAHRAKPTVLGFIPLSDRRRSIGRAIVDDDAFPVPERLLLDAPESVLEEAGVVVGRDDDADRRPIAATWGVGSSALATIDQTSGGPRDRRSVPSGGASRRRRRDVTHAT